jgi:hypothetical protein
MVEVNPNDMTEKQKETMHVSKYDNSSKLDKLYTEVRKNGLSNLTKNQLRHMKKRLGLR